MTNRSTKKLKNILRRHSANIYVEKPCKIIKVHSQNLVDVEYYDDYKTDVLYKVPVQHIRVKDAYIFIKLNEGDRGTVRFLDNDSSYYYKGSDENGNDSRTHNINDGIFFPGYYPSNEIFEFYESDLAIKSGNACIYFKNGNVYISGAQVFINGVDFKIHTHMAGDVKTTGVSELSGEGG